MLLALLLGCWAPELAPAPAPPGAPEGPAAAEVGAPLPSPPFPARTVSAPLTLVGPGGVALAQLGTPDLEVEVLQVLAHRVRVRCTGCPAPARDLEGWLQREAVRPTDAPAAGG